MKGVLLGTFVVAIGIWLLLPILRSASSARVFRNQRAGFTRDFLLHAHLTFRDPALRQALDFGVQDDTYHGIAQVEMAIPLFVHAGTIWFVRTGGRGCIGGDDRVVVVITDPDGELASWKEVEELRTGALRHQLLDERREEFELGKHLLIVDRAGTITVSNAQAPRAPRDRSPVEDQLRALLLDRSSREDAK